MKKNLGKHIYFIAGIINIVASIMYFRGNIISWGVTHLVLALGFIVLGVIYRKK